MDLFLTLTLIILHQITSALCKPYSEPTSEDKTGSSETAIAELFKDINELNLNYVAPGPGNVGDRNVLHMIQLVHKDGSKAPVAIILTPADLATAINSKYQHLHENKQVLMDAIENRASDSKSHELPIDLNSPKYEVNETKEATKSQNQIDDTVSLGVSTAEEFLQNQRTPATNISVNNLITITDGEQLNENIPESKKNSNENDYGLLNEYNLQRNIETVDDLYDNTYYKKEGNYQTYDYSLMDSELNKKDEGNHNILKEDKLYGDSIEYVTFKSNNSTSHEDQGNLRETILSSELIKADANENFSDKFIVVPNIDEGNSIISDISFEGPKNNEGYPTIVIDDNAKKINTKCLQGSETYIKEKDGKTSARTFNLSFVFNR